MGRIILNNEEYTGSSGSAPVTDVTVNGSSVVNAQGGAEITEVDDVGLTSTLELGTSTADGALDGQLELWGGTPLFRGKATLKAHHAQTGDLTFELPATSGMLARKSDIPTKTSDLTNDSDFVSDNPTFTEASTRANIASGESFATILGKIKKFFTDLKAVAFSGSYNDLSDKPTIPVGSDYVQKSGDTMTGLLKFSAYGFRTYQDWGYDIGDSGNFHHLRNAQWDNWQIQKYDNTEALTYTFERGELTNYGDVIINHKDGTTSAAGTTVLSLGNNIAEGADKNSKGLFRVYSNTAKKTEITAPSLTADRTLSLPDKSGTVALTSDVDTKVSKSGDTMSGALTIQNIGDSIVLNRANSNTFSSWIVFKNSSGVIGQYSVDQNGRPRYIANNDSSNIKQIALTSDIQLGNAMGNTGYVSNDTHYLKLCTITLGDYYEYVSLLITSSFWGNQHGSADIINIQASRGSSSTETGATVQRFHLAGSGGNGSYREFYYTNSNNTLTLYVYVTGGNSYGSWNISELRLKNVGITYNFTTNVSLPSDANSIYSSTTFDSLTAYEFQLTHSGLDFYDPIFDKHMYLIRPGTLSAERSIYLPNKNGTIALLSDISSRRYKENIVPLSDDEAKKLLDIDIVNYDYKEGVVEEDERYDQKGAIAEDVVNIIPNAVTYADVDGEQLPDGINYTKFIPYLIKMVQIQQKEIDELKAMIKEE